jgi:DNA repair protein RadC
MATFTVKEKATGKYVSGPQDIFKSLKRVSMADQESFWVMGFNPQRFEILRECIFKGGIKSFYIDQTIIFRRILMAGAVSWLCLHNHPSDCCEPSDEDKEGARSLLASSQILRLEMVDYMIITEGKYFSFHDEGLFKSYLQEGKLAA